jgi:hypothetical protein
VPQPSDVRRPQAATGRLVLLPARFACAPQRTAYVLDSLTRRWEQAETEVTPRAPRTQVVWNKCSFFFYKRRINVLNGCSIFYR